MTLDINEDGLNDSLMISTGLSVSTAGLYYVSAALMKNDTLIIQESSSPVNLLSGTNTINFAFDGKTIGELGMDGPYYFTGLAIWNEDQRHVLSPDIHMTDPYLASSFQKEALILKGNYAESTNDEDSDGKIDNLTISFELEIITGGQYEMNANLASGTGDFVSSTSLHTALTQGGQTLNLTFDGQGINLSGIDGSYDLTLSAWDTLGNLIFYSEDVYTTSAYTLAQFESMDAIITENYSESTPDVDQDGYHDSLLVDVELSVAESGTYMIRGECLDTTLQIIHEAEVTSTLNAGTHSLRLAFDGKEFFKNGVDGPYILANLFLYRIDGENWSNLDVVDFAYATEDYGALEFQHTDAYLAEEYKDFGVDQDENGLYDVLVVEIGLHIESAGNFRIQGQLYDNKGYYIETASIEDYMAEGHDTVSFEFSGGRIRGHGNAAPYHLRYVRIFDDYNQVLQSVDDAHTTKLYNADQFEMSEADLIIYSTEVVLQEGIPGDNRVSLKAKVYNFGGTKVDSVLVKFYSRDLGLNELKPLYNITGEAPGEVSVDLTLPQEDSIYYFTLTVDPHDNIPEMSEMNNESRFGIQTPLSDFPDPPDEISIVADADSVMLNWSAVAGSNSGFNVYRRIKGDADFHKLNSMLLYDRFFVDTTVIGDTVYYYAVTSYLVSAPCLEGAFSDEAKAETREVLMEISLTENKAYAKEEFILPVKIADLKGNSINSASLKIAVNSDVLECKEASITGTMAEEWTDFTYDCKANGEIWIEMSGTTPLSDAGTLVEIKYDVTGNVGDNSTIRILECVLNDGIPQVTTSSGLLTVEIPSNLPSRSESGQVKLRNYPNPFSHTTTIEYTNPDLFVGTRVTLDVFNLNMVKVTSLVNHVQTAGTYHESWDGCDFNGNRLASGIYIYRLKTGENLAYGRMMIIE